MKHSKEYNVRLNTFLTSANIITPFYILVNMIIPELIKKATITVSDEPLTIWIYEAGGIYDIVLSASSAILKQIKKRYKFVTYIEHSIFGYPVVIYDTTYDLESAVNIMNTMKYLLGGMFPDDVLDKDVIK